MGFGFDTINADGYAGHADLGQSEDVVTVLVHLDVVPEGKGWDYPPFGGEIHNGKIYGRGIIDDKGPAIASLYAMKALKESGKQLKKKIRIILALMKNRAGRTLTITLNTTRDRMLVFRLMLNFH
jgi:succinyl-diaminopimelate desuccinylase